MQRGYDQGPVHAPDDELGAVASATMGDSADESLRLLAAGVAARDASAAEARPHDRRCLRTPWVRHAVGAGLLVSVALLWTVASYLVQYIYNTLGFGNPLVITYISNLLFVVLVPMDRLTLAPPSAAARGARRRACACPRFREQYKPFVKPALIIAPLWLLAQGTYNWSLRGTTVAVSTVLSTSSCVTTYILSLCLGDTPHWAPIAGCVLTMAGAAFVAFDPAGGAGDDDGGGGGGATNTSWGVLVCCVSAIMYSLYTTSIKLLVEQESDDGGFRGTARFFGLLGAANGVMMLPVVLLAPYLGFADTSMAGFTATVLGWIILKGTFDNLLSDPLWSAAIVLTSPTAATVGLSLTIPLAVLGDLVVSGAVPSASLVVGALCVMIGFVTIATRPSGATKPAAAEGPAEEAKAGGSTAP